MLLSLIPSEKFTELHREEKREEGDRGDQGDKGGIKRREREIQPVISSPSVLSNPEHTKRFTDLGREEKEEGGDRADLGEKRETTKGREQTASNHTAK